jgi:type IV secretory pathway TraG/TraD family ATPase VirD4
MVFGKLFGSGGNKRRQEAVEAENFRQGLEAPMRALLDLIHDMPVDRASKLLLRQKIIQRDKGELERTLQNVILPKLDPAWQARIKELGKSEAWMTFLEFRETPMCRGRTDERMDMLHIGNFPVPAELSRTGEQSFAPVVFSGDGHLLTVAPTGAGKGQSFILRNLYNYEGPTVVFDPKGELYLETAWRRDWYGKVFKFAPEDPDTDCFNPMDMLTPLPGEDSDVVWDNARQLAELLIEPMGKEPFWDNTAKDLVTALIFYVYHTYPQRQRNIREVTRLLYLDEDRRDALIEKLKDSDEERLRELGATLLDVHENMRTSITHTLRTQLEIWRSGKVMRVTRGTSHGLHPHTIAGDDHMRWFLHAQGAEDKPGFWLEDDNTAITGDAHTVFVVVPPEQISMYRSVVRVVLGMMLQGVMAHRRYLEREAQNGHSSMPEGQWPFLFLFDELPQLGYMRIVEDAISIARGANIRLWLLAQDLSQLRNVYPRWETLIANSRAQMFFRPNDLGTAQYISDLLGEHPDLWGNRTPLAAPNELMGNSFRDDVILRFQGHKPIRARMPMFWDESESAKKMVANAKARLGEVPVREREPWPIDGLTLEELKIQNEAMRKQVPEGPAEPRKTDAALGEEEDVRPNEQAADPEPESEAAPDYELTEDGLPKPPRLE